MLPSSPSQPAAFPTALCVPVAFPATSRGYDIQVGVNLLSDAGQRIEATLGKRRCVVVTDSNVAPLYLKRLEATLIAAGHDVGAPIVVPAGESSKSYATLQSVLDQLFAQGADRKTLLIALGGGVIGDLTGFTASIFMRGIDVVQFPTTLLAQVDSSVGGKTGIDTPHGKNTVGSFYQPRLVLIDVTTLDSLPTREVLAGYAEVVKYGLIMDKEFFAWCAAHGAKLLNGDRESQRHAIAACCAMKAQIVAEDEHDNGKRGLLNLGHTFGHALEAELDYDARLLHGEAVAIGTAMAFQLSAELGLCPSWDAQAVLTHFKEIGLPLAPPAGTYDVDALMQRMGHDKKAEAGKLVLILARGIGQAEIVRDVNPYPVRVLWKNTLGI
jgi:3-dehydroquinate synthase